MTLSLILALFLSLTVVLGDASFASGQTVKAQDLRNGLPFEPDPMRGYATAVKLCTGCHIIDLKQTGKAQPGVPSFLYMANKPMQTVRKLSDSMIHPYPPMIDTHLTMHEIKDISAYILSLKSDK